MKIADFLAPANVKIDVASTDKKKLLAELAREAAAKIGIGADRIAAEVLKREEFGSTGVGGGVAIPHARFPQSSKPLGLLARLKKPIDYDAVDGKPVDIVFLLLLPEGAGGEQQLGALASIARKLRIPAVTAALRRARQYGHISHIDIRLTGGHIGAKSNTLPSARALPILGAHC